MKLWQWVRNHIAWMVVLICVTGLGFVAGRMSRPSWEEVMLDYSRFLLCYSARPATAIKYAEMVTMCDEGGAQYGFMVTKPY